MLPFDNFRVFYTTIDSARGQFIQKVSSVNRPDTEVAQLKIEFIKLFRDKQIGTL